MSKYARDTSVSVEKSRMEIEQTVRRYGATGFASGWQGDRASLQFVIANRHIRFIMEFPSPSERRFTHTKGRYQARTQIAATAAWEQACRQKWRALALLVKAKLEAVDAKISTVEEAFFADIVLPDGKTVYESARDNVRIAYESGEPVRLLSAH
jgi:hypothetical protein